MGAQFKVIGIVVRDMAASVGFYQKLGLPFPSEIDDHMTAELPSGISIMLDTVEVIHSFDPTWTAPMGGQAIGLGFHFDTPAEVDATFESLVSEGYKGAKAPWNAFWGQRYAQIKDPDGNVIDLFSEI